MTITQPDTGIEPITPTASGALYELRNASRHYGDGSNGVKALDDVSVAIDRGEFVVVEGASGSGKTTMLQLLGALDVPTGGTILFEGRDLAALTAREQDVFRRDDVGFVFQHFNLIPTLTARQNVETAMVPRGVGAAERTRRAAELLERVGLGGRLDHVPSQLSGGEQQRVAIARSLANDAGVLLADEPTGNLDSSTGAEVLNLLHRLWSEQGLTIVLITHDTEVAKRAGRLLRMLDGRIVEDRRIG